MIIQLVTDVEKQMNIDTEEILNGTAKYKKKKVMTPETFAKIFSPQRIRLLKEIKRGNFNSISELARRLDRKFEAVHRDIKYLKGMDLIQVRRNDKRVVPVVTQVIRIPSII